MRRTLLALPLLLAACGGWPAGSYVQSVSDADATVLAPAVADCVAAILPSRQDLRLEPAGAGDPIAPLLPPLLDRASDLPLLQIGGSPGKTAPGRLKT